MIGNEINKPFINEPFSSTVESSINTSIIVVLTDHNKMLAIRINSKKKNIENYIVKKCFVLQ